MKKNYPLISKNAFIKRTTALTILAFVMSLQWSYSQFTPIDMRCEIDEPTITLSENESFTLDPYVLLNDECFGGHENIDRIELDKSTFTYADIGMNIVRVTMYHILEGNIYSTRIRVYVVANETFEIKSETITNATCTELGSIDIEVGAVDDTVTYNWSNGETTQDISNLTPGDYTVTITKANADNIVKTFTVGDDKSVIEATVNLSTIGINTCSFFDEAHLLYGYPNNETTSVEITTNVTGGEDNYTYAWEPAEMFDDPTSATPIFSPISTPTDETTTYNINLTITDSLGCSLTKETIINAVNVNDESRKHKNNKKVLICHEGRKTLSVSYKAIPAHLAHGDCLGSCNEQDDVFTARNSNEEAIIAQAEELLKIDTKHFKVFPNPSNGEFEIIINNDINKAYVQLFDISGKVLEQKTVTAIKTTIGNQNLSKGTYFLRVTTKNETITKKLIVK